MIKRSLFSDIKAHLKNPEITLIIGPRQAGKTTLMRQLMDDLNKDAEKTLFLSLDNDLDRPYFDSQDALIGKIELAFGNQKGYVFIDEIQRKVDAGLFLKGIYDRGLPYKFIVTGSGSVELKERVHESLVGRKRLFELSTLSFGEFVNYKTEYRYESKLADFFLVESGLTQKYFQEYLDFGGYPRVVLAETEEEKRKTIQDIYESYLEKDIALLLNIQKTVSLTNLVRLLASQAGGLVNVSEISSTLGISVETVNNYLWYLEKTYIVERVTPFFKNIRKEITKSPIYYFVDLGMKNYAQRQFGSSFQHLADGHLFENFVYLLLKGSLIPPTSLHFWRTQDKAEVDFVIDFGNEIVPVEVKATKLTEPKITRSFRSFTDSYQPKEAYVIHLGKEFQFKINNLTVSFLPYFSLLTNHISTYDGD
ncbi:MAG: ATP-binding protein [Candidatus Shapirobacteria bacterium]|jgi:hypothetical protein